MYLDRAKSKLMECLIKQQYVNFKAMQSDAFLQGGHGKPPKESKAKEVANESAIPAKVDKTVSITEPVKKLERSASSKRALAATVGKDMLEGMVFQL
jgi:hypothetical protein